MREGYKFHGLRMAAVAVAAMVVVGCGGKSKHCKRYNDDTEVYMDLKATGRLTNQAERFARLQAIATRHSLSRSDQVLIIEEVAHSGLSDAEKLDVMVTLIRNPVLTPNAKASMLCFVEKGKLPAGPGQELLKAFIDYPTTRDVDSLLGEPEFVSAVRTDRIISGAPLMAQPMVQPAVVPAVRATMITPATPVVHSVAPTVVTAPAPAQPAMPVITPIPVQ